MMNGAKCMNKRLLLFSMLCVVYNGLYAQDDFDQEEMIMNAEPIVNTRNKRPFYNKKNFIFQFENKDLVDVINLIAAEKGINIVLPQKMPIDSKLTFNVEEKMSVDEAWNLLYSILDLAGYTVKEEGDLFVIIRIPDAPGALATEPMPTYIGTPFDELPDGDMRIRYVHYLTNMKVPVPGVGLQKSEVEAILEHILPATDRVGDKFLMDSNANALILTGKASNIKGAISVINQLDKEGFHEKMEIVKLKHTTANVVSRLFTENILKPASASHMRGDIRRQGETYFAPNTRIVSEDRSNSLIVVGRAQAVDRIKDFIETYIDIEPDSGRSILHVYTLLYLDAQQMVPVLESVIGQDKSGGTGQSASERRQTGPERFFDPIIIMSDKPESYQQNTDDKTMSKYQYSGGNKLIIAARNDDWKRIKNLLEQLDKPFPQVFIEVLIADIDIDDLRQLGAQSRNLNSCLPSNINIQAAQLANPIVDTSFFPGTIAGDLSAPNALFPNSSGATTCCNNIPALAQAGSTIISFNDKDGQTWSLLQMLQSFGVTKVISHPHVVSINNKPASISIGQTRLVQGEASLGTQAANIKQDPIRAMLKVDITPRISPDKVINLNVDITINTFSNSSSIPTNTILVREVHTNANVRNKSILALGGLVSTEVDDAANETPWFADIPIFGWLVKNRRSRTIRENLTVFISPTIIMPNLRGGIHQHAKDYIDFAKHSAQEASLFDSLRDPVTRWFFRDDEIQAAESLDEFIKDDDSLNDKTIKVPGSKETKRRERHAVLVQNKVGDDRTQTLRDLVQADEKNPLLKSSRHKKAAAAA
jgi:general secretion pathway protein D